MTHPAHSSCRRPSLSSILLRGLTYAAAAVTAGAFLALTAYILIQGIPNLRPGLFALHYTSDDPSMLPAILNTVTMVLCCLLLSVPLGLGAAVYLVEYAGRGSRVVGLIRLTAETLAGIPSIVYGLFGFLLFNIALGLGNAMLGGVLTMSMMILPTILRTAEEALTAVPDAWREGSFGLGAGRLRTVFRVVLPAAMPGITSGILLAMGRIVGETAALVFTAGTATGVAGLMDSGRTLAVHLYALLNEGLFMEEAYATAVVLLALTVLMNGLSALLTRQRKER